MKRLFVFFLAVLICLSSLFSKGVYEKAYDEFWEILDDYYPQTKVAEKAGLDLDSIKKEGREQVKNIKRDEELALILRGIANKFAPFDYIDINIQTTTNSGIENPEKGQYTPNYQYIPSLKTVVFSINSLSFNDKYIESALEEIEDVEHIVFDLTTCNTMTNNLDPILSPFGGDWTYNYTGYFKNKDIWKLFPEEDIKKTEKKSKAYEYGLKYCTERTVSFEYGDGRIEGKAKDAKRWILVGDLTAFGADYLSSFAKATGWATVVGNPTSGNGTGLPMLSVSIPKTNIIVSFNPIVLDNGKGELKTMSGNVPDETAQRGKTALNVCISLIETLMENQVL
ncbi:MAG: S41 family peptidase [Spirochaetales bacterium]|nr:S41 family peptidase [Spirochaetales bacterium]